MHIPAAKPDNDLERVAFLQSLLILDTDSEESFDRITKAASKLFNCPICLVSLVDAERQWFKSCIGLDVSQTHRDYAFCAHAILPAKPTTLIVEDAALDERFKESPLVTGAPFIRFYAGAPLVYTDDNLVEWKLGTLCIIAPTPRTMADDEIVLLEMLARLVVAELELRMKLRKSVLEFKSEADKQALLRAVELNAAYIGQVAHDLRTPLNSFSLGLEFLMGHSNMTPDQLSVIETMKISAELMDMTCTKAVDHTNFEMGVTMAAKKAPFNLKDLLKKSQIVIAGYTHESKGVKYEFHIDQGVASEIICDKEWFWHMLMNYMSNARKFTTEGSIRVSASVVSSSGRDFLRLEVADTGIGIEEESKKKLFKPFTQLQADSGGTGLGLHSVSKKIEVLGGQCGVKDNKPKGCIFWFEIPYTPVRAQEETVNAAIDWDDSSKMTFVDLSPSSILAAASGSTEQEPIPSSPECSKEDPASRNSQKLVLLIEDDVPTRKLMTRALEKKGLIVEQAVNGVEGLEKLKRGIFHVVLCDVMMPVMDGIECIRRFRQWEKVDRPNVAPQFVVALSANTDSADVAKSFEVGMNFFYPKPIKVPDLLKNLDGKYMDDSVVNANYPVLTSKSS